MQREGALSVSEAMQPLSKICSRTFCADLQERVDKVVTSRVSQAEMQQKLKATLFHPDWSLAPQLGVTTPLTHLLSYWDW